MAQEPGALTSRPGLRTDGLDRMQQRAFEQRAAIGRDVHELESRFRRALDPRLQIAKHPFVAAAVVLGGVFVAARIVRSILRRVRPNRAGEPRRRRSREILAAAHASGRRAGASGAHLKEARE